MAPTVSVIMATRNDARYLSSSVESILEQDFTDFEFIIIDDASTDETPRILDQYTDPRIVRLRNETNKKLPASLNMGLAIAQGEFIARMDGDDISSPCRLRKQVEFMRENTDIGVLGTSYTWIDTQSQIKGHIDQPLSNGLILWGYLSRLTYPIRHGSILARQNLLVEVGGYNTAFTREQDGELFLRLIYKTKLANLPERLYSARFHRRKHDADRIFYDSYPFTLQLRSTCLSTLLEREVSKDEMAKLIFPSSRRRWPNLKISLSVSDLTGSILLLMEMFQALKDQGFLEISDEQFIKEDLARLIVNNSSISEDQFLYSADRMPIALLFSAAFRRSRKRLLDVAIWKELHKQIQRTIARRRI